jgi:hypothetical protein
MITSQQACVRPQSPLACRCFLPAVNGIIAFPVEVDAPCGWWDTFMVIVGLPDTAAKKLRPTTQAMDTCLLSPIRNIAPEEPTWGPSLRPELLRNRQRLSTAADYSPAVRATPKWGPGATPQAASRRLASLRPAAALPHWGWPGRLARSFVKGIVAFQAPKKKLPIVIKNLDSIRTPL